MVKFKDLNPDLDTVIVLRPKTKIICEEVKMLVGDFDEGDFDEVTFLKVKPVPGGMNAVMLSNEKFHSFVFIDPDVEVVERRCRKKRGIFCFLSERNNRYQTVA